MDAVDRLLVELLEAQRKRVFEVLAGLDDAQLLKAVLPPGWTPLGMVEHLGHAERHWFQQVALGTADPLPWEGDGSEPLSTSQAPDAVFAFYRDQIARANVVLASTSLSKAPSGGAGAGRSVSQSRPGGRLERRRAGILCGW